LPDPTYLLLIEVYSPSCSCRGYILQVKKKKTKGVAERPSFAREVREGKDEPLGEDGVHPLEEYDKIRDKAL